MPSLYTSENTYLADSIYPYMHIHASGDFNGDGLLDFFGAFNEFGTEETFEIVIYSQSPSTGYMTDVTSDWIIGDIPKTIHGRTVEVRDFNGDGVADIFIGDTGRDTPPDFPGAVNVLLLSQDGKLINTSSTLPQLPDFTHGSASGDIDGDGDIDIFVGNFTSASQSSIPYFLMNEGNGVFTQNTSFVPVSLLTDGDIQIGTAELADFNGDGHVDLVIGSHSNSSNRLYLGDGSGNFQSDNFTNLPVQLLGGVAGNAVWMHSFDLENDGDLDIAISYYGQPEDWLNPNSSSNRAIQVLENMGGGEFQDVTGRFPLAVLDDGHTPAQWFVKVASKDLNNDGFEDLYVSNLNTAGQPAFGGTPVAWITNQEGGYTVLTQEHFSNQFGNSGYPGPFEFVGSGNDIFSIGYRAEFLRNTIDFDQIVAPRLGKTFYSTSADELFNGGAGFDTAVYSGNQSSYTLTLSPTSTLITDRRADGNGTDTLIDMEFVDFDTGADFNLTKFGGPTSLSPEAFESFIELYIAYFNRAPDAIGLNFWGTAYANGTSLEEMAALFGPQEETLATYPEGTSNEDFAFSVYTNVLGRDPDAAGYEFWVDQLDAGNFSRDQFILQVLRGVEDGSPDRVYLDSKVDVGAYFSVIKGMSDVANASAAMALFDGTPAGINNAVNAIDGFYQDALDPNNGEFIMQVVGILDDPFAIA